MRSFTWLSFCVFFSSFLFYFNICSIHGLLSIKEIKTIDWLKTVNSSAWSICVYFLSRFCLHLVFNIIYYTLRHIICVFLFEFFYFVCSFQSGFDHIIIFVIFLHIFRYNLYSRNLFILSFFFILFHIWWSWLFCICLVFVLDIKLHFSTEKKAGVKFCYVNIFLTVFIHTFL